VRTHDGLDSEACRECGSESKAKEPRELAVSSGIRVRSDDPPQRVPEGQSGQGCDAGRHRRIDQAPPGTRERKTAADDSEVGAGQHHEGKHSAAEQAHREQGRGEKVSLPDSLVKPYCGPERQGYQPGSDDGMLAQPRDDGPVGPGHDRHHDGPEGPEPAAFPAGDENGIAEPVNGCLSA
jgi:hypothetical protein